MPWTAAAIVGGAVIGGLASDSASDKQEDAANRATDISNAQYNQTREDQAPFREAGYSALNRLQELLGTGGNAGAAGYGSLTRPFTGSDLASDPGYQFSLAEGERGIQRQATAAGRNYSGATLRALQRYGQGLASTTFNDAFNRNQVTGNSLFNRLSGLSGTGQTATNQVGEAGQRFADAAGNNMIGAANVSAANRINQGNIWGNAANQGLAAWQRYNSQPQTGYADRSAFRSDDPYQNPGYFAGGEGE